MNLNLIPIIAAVTMVVVIFTLVVLVFSRYVRVGPNQLLIVSGRRYQLPDGRVVGFRVVKGGGTFVMPIFERADVLPLEVLSIELPRTRARASGGAGLEVDGLAQVKINSDDASIGPATEFFLGKTTAEIKGIVRPVLEKHLAEALASSTVASVIQNPAGCAAAAQTAASRDLARMGLSVISVTLRNARTT